MLLNIITIKIRTFNYEFIRHVPLSFQALYARQVRIM